MYANKNISQVWAKSRPKYALLVFCFLAGGFLLHTNTHTPHPNIDCVRMAGSDPGYNSY